MSHHSQYVNQEKATLVSHFNGTLMLLTIKTYKIMDDFTFLNLMIGPLGKSFKIIRQRGKLYSEEDFVELTETQYASYTAKVGKPKNALYSIGYDAESNLLEIVDELEKCSLMQASTFIRNSVGEISDQPLADAEIIEKFASVFPFLTK